MSKFNIPIKSKAFSHCECQQKDDGTYTACLWKDGKIDRHIGGEGLADIYRTLHNIL